MKAKKLKAIGLVLTSILMFTACATTTKVGAAASVARTVISPAQSTGYDWRRVLPAPPSPGDPVDLGDMAMVRQAQSLEGTERWTQAAQDASLDVFKIYGPIIGDGFTAANRPEIVALMAYAGRQLSLASSEAKREFARPRPFIASPDLRICLSNPPAEYSFPSGHAGWGWLSAQIIARVETAHTSAILARGRDYGQSRVVCAVHYPSDLEAGRYLADAVLLRLDSDPEYQRLMAAAKGQTR